MVASTLIRSLVPIGTVLTGLLLVGRVEAGWLTIQNTSRQRIVIQETTIQNGKVQRGRPVTLLPGETMREFVDAQDTKRIEILDPQRPRKSLWSGTLSSKSETQAFVLSELGGRWNVRPVSAPATKK